MNWKKIISNLIDGGYTQPMIAKACGCAQATVSDLATGKTKSPRYEIGAALLSLSKKTDWQEIWPESINHEKAV